MGPSDIVFFRYVVIGYIHVGVCIARELYSIQVRFIRFVCTTADLCNSGTIDRRSCISIG